MQEGNTALLQPGANDLALLGEHLLSAVKIAAEAERRGRLRKISLLHKVQHHIRKRQIDLIGPVGRGACRGNVDDLDIHRRTGAQHRKVHRGKRTGKARAHRIARLDARFFQKLHAQRRHIGVRCGALGVRCADGRGDGRVILAEHSRLVPVLVGKRDTELCLICLDPLHAGFQPLRRVHTDGVILRRNAVSALHGQCACKHQHERREQEREPCHPSHLTALPPARARRRRARSAALSSQSRQAACPQRPDGRTLGPVSRG